MSLVASFALPGADDPINVAQTVGFAAIAVMMVVSAVRVVTTKNVVHAAMWLVLVLAGSAAQYILLAAEFVAVTQVMVYIGAVVVLLLFGVMLTRAKMGQDPDMTGRSWVGGAIAALALFGVLTYSVVDTFEDAKIPEERMMGMPVEVAEDAAGGRAEGATSNTAAISDSIFSRYLVQFEAVGVLLTAALIGAIVIARRD